MRLGRSKPQYLPVELTKVSFYDALRESMFTIARRPARTIFCALGTVLGIAVFEATVGMSLSASASVSKAFNAQEATEVSFQETTASTAAPHVLTQESEERMDRVPGVTGAGLFWLVDNGQSLAVGKTPLSAATGTDTVELPFTVASPSALQVMGATVAYGRLYDVGFERRHEMVALLGATAAKQLGIVTTSEEPAIFVGPNAFTVIGIVASAKEQSQATLGVIIPPSEAASVLAATTPRTLIVNTKPGAAQVVGNEGSTVLSPLDPAALNAQVPPSPQLLRQTVESSVSDLLIGLSLLAFVLGMVVIANTTLLSVMQRRPEIGLRRALGARPRHVAELVLLEAALIGALGGVVGGSLGVVATALGAHAFGWLPASNWRFEVLAPAFGILAGVAAGAYPSWRAGRVEPVAALQDQ